MNGDHASIDAIVAFLNQSGGLFIYGHPLVVFAPKPVNYNCNHHRRTNYYINIIFGRFLNFSATDNVDVVVAPPSPYLAYVKDKLKGSIKVASQNCYKVSY